MFYNCLFGNVSESTFMKMQFSKVAGVIIIYLFSSSLVIHASNDANDLLLSLEENNALAKLKSIVTNSIKEDFMKSEFYLIRWLRRAHLNVQNARNLVLQEVKWREKNNMSTIMSEDWSDLEQDYHMGFEGFDKMGRPILTIDLGDWDLRAAVVQGKIRRLQRYLTYSTEKSTQRVFEIQQKTGKPVTRSVVLVDTDGVNARQHGCPMCLAFLVQWTIEKEQHYPGFTEETVIINAPVVGAFILNACRAVMSPEQNAQTKSFDQNKKVWMRYLDERIDRSERTLQYGGTKRN